MSRCREHSLTLCHSRTFSHTKRASSRRHDGAHSSRPDLTPECCATSWRPPRMPMRCRNLTTQLGHFTPPGLSTAAPFPVRNVGDSLVPSTGGGGSSSGICKQTRPRSQHASLNQSALTRGAPLPPPLKSVFASHVNKRPSCATQLRPTFPSAVKS